MNTEKVTEKVNYSYPAVSRAGRYVVITRTRTATLTAFVNTLDEARAAAAAVTGRVTILTPRPTR